MTRIDLPNLQYESSDSLYLGFKGFDEDLSCLEKVNNTSRDSDYNARQVALSARLFVCLSRTPEYF